jgi:hypothetical protein
LGGIGNSVNGSQSAGMVIAPDCLHSVLRPLRWSRSMNRLLVCLGLALSLSCNYNQYHNKETGTPDTSGKDVPTQRTTAPERQMMEATSQAQTRESNGATRQ